MRGRPGLPPGSIRERFGRIRPKNSLDLKLCEPQSGTLPASGHQSTAQQSNRPLPLPFPHSALPKLRYPFAPHLRDPTQCRARRECPSSVSCGFRATVAGLMSLPSLKALLERVTACTFQGT